jgi:hypothetical protein
MKSVLKMPNNAIAQLELKFLEYRVEDRIEGKDFAPVDVIAGLPAE